MLLPVDQEIFSSVAGLAQQRWAAQFCSVLEYRHREQEGLGRCIVDQAQPKVVAV
jgi:hypothetical protein